MVVAVRQPAAARLASENGTLADQKRKREDLGQRAGCHHQGAPADANRGRRQRLFFYCHVHVTESISTNNNHREHNVHTVQPV